MSDDTANHRPEDQDPEPDHTHSTVWNGEPTPDTPTEPFPPF
ncbi:MAG TPA: hypothetical protein VFY14_16860 [Streptomyces sp.]|nr:hypothetical protein [Streptomyces sp.]